MKFKVGDRVKIVKDDNGYTKFIGLIKKITCVDNSDYTRYIYTLENISECTWSDEELELAEMNMFKKSDLKNGDIVTLRNGDKLRVYDDDQFSQEQEEYNNYVDGFYEFVENLKYTYCGDKPEYDIVKVERIKEYEVIFERDERIKEMTVSEISKALGYDVKIVKEK